MISFLLKGAFFINLFFCALFINSKPAADCSDADMTPTITTLGNPGNKLEMPVFMDVVQVEGNYYGFVTNNTPGKLSRLDFGNSLLNTPKIAELFNARGGLPDAMEGIQVVQNEGKWYAIIVGGNENVGGSRILKVEFGKDIKNIHPTVIDWGNIGGLNYPTDLHLFKDEKNNWYGFTNNFNNHTITRFYFSDNFDKAPKARNLGSFDLLNRPSGMNVIEENGQWFMFVTNRDDNKLIRLDFGKSMLDQPKAIDLGNPNGVLNQPRDFVITKDACGNNIGYALNEGDNTVSKFNFSNSLMNEPVATSLGNIGGLAFPASFSTFVKEGDLCYSFLCNANNNTISRFKFPASVPAVAMPNQIVANTKRD